MTPNWLERTELLIKTEGVAQLQKSHVLVVGLGGVGSYAAEFLARAGVGALTIVDGDVVDATNCNRQLIALTSTVAMPKVAVMQQRILDINPHINLTAIQQFIAPNDVAALLARSHYDYIIEAIDSLKPKLTLIETAYRKKIKIISSMGAGGKINPTLVQITDISKTTECKLAKYTRKRLKKAGISKGIKVVFSPEPPDKSSLKHTNSTLYKKSYYGTISYIPALFGLHAAAEVVQHLLKKAKNEPF